MLFCDYHATSRSIPESDFRAHRITDSMSALPLDSGLKADIEQLPSWAKTGLIQREASWLKRQAV
jgi:hypothetical protein